MSRLKKPEVKAKKKSAKKPEPKKVPPPAMPHNTPKEDLVLNNENMVPKGVISPALAEMLFGPNKPQLLVVKTPLDGIKNKAEFTAAMGALNIRVVYLEYSAAMGIVPTIERVSGVDQI